MPPKFLYLTHFVLIYLFQRRFYLFIHERHRERETERERQRHRQRGKQAPWREPEVGLDPGSPGSHPGPKADTKPLSHPGIPSSRILMDSCLTFRSFIHFECIFVSGVREWSSFILLHVAVLFPQHHLLKRLSLSEHFHGNCFEF